MSNQVVKDIANEGHAFFDTLQAQQKTYFGENQTALDTLSKAWAPVLSSGAVPYGYSAGLDSLLQANVMQTGAQASANAINAEALHQKQETGGANVLPTGANEAINAEILARGQQATATGLQNEKIAGYEQGLKNLEGGTQAELGIINATDPVKAAEAATQAGGLAEKAGSDEFEENQQTGPMATFKGITSGLGDLAGGIAKVAGAGLIPGVPASGPKYHKGGIVRGKKGKEVSITVMPGEYVVPEPKTKKQKTLLDRALANA